MSRKSDYYVVKIFHRKGENAMENNIKERITFQEGMEMFMKSLDSRDCSNYTLKNYHHILETFYIHMAKEVFNGEVYVQDITSHHIEEHLLYRKNVLNNSPVTRLNALIAIQSMYKYLLRHHYVNHNPADDVDRIKLPKRERVYLTAEEIHLVLNAIKNPHIYAAAATLAYTGLRISELVSLKISDVDLEKQEIFVRCGKNKKDRVVPFSDDLKRILNGYVKNHRSNKTDYFFATPRTGRICPSYINEKLHEAADEVGLQKNISAHILRHSAASLMVLNQAPISSVQKMLGHSDIKTTSLYLHVLNDDLHQAAELLKY